MKRLLLILLIFSAVAANCQICDSLKKNMKMAFKKENFDLSLIYADSLLNIATTAKDTNNIMVAYYYKGYANQKKGNIEDGLKFSTLCYDFASIAGDEEIMSSSLNNIGNIYMANKQDSIALVYFTRSLEIERKLGNLQNQGTRLGNISGAYMRLGDYDNALEYAKQGLEADIKVGRKDKIAIRYNQIGNIYTRIEKFSEALEYQTNAYKYFETAGSNYGMCITSFSIGQIYDRLANFKECKQYYMQALAYAEIIHNHVMIEKIYKQLYDCSRNIDPAFSLKYLELYTKVKDSVYTTENQRLLQEFQAKYDSQEKQHEIERQKTEIQDATRNFYVIIAFAILLIIIIILLIFQAKSAKNKQLLLEKINDTKDRALSIITHDLKNPAIAERRVLYQLKKCHRNLSDEEFNSIINSIINSSEMQLGLLSNLLEWTRFQIGKREFTPITFDLNSCIKDIIMLYDNNLTLKNIKVEFDDSRKNMAFSDINFISTVIRNLVSNASKYSNEGSTIEIKVSDESDDKYLLSVVDHGIGMTEENIVKILKQNEDKIGTKPGTKGEPGNGFGLSICKKLLETCNEKYYIESQIGIGSIFSFTITKSNSKTAESWKKSKQ